MSTKTPPATMPFVIVEARRCGSQRYGVNSRPRRELRRKTKIRPATRPRLVEGTDRIRRSVVRSLKICNLLPRLLTARRHAAQLRGNLMLIVSELHSIRMDHEALTIEEGVAGRATAPLDFGFWTD